MDCLQCLRVSSNVSERKCASHRKWMPSDANCPGWCLAAIPSEKPVSSSRELVEIVVHILRSKFPEIMLGFGGHYRSRLVPPPQRGMINAGAEDSNSPSRILRSRSSLSPRHPRGYCAFAFSISPASTRISRGDCHPLVSSS